MQDEICRLCLRVENLSSLFENVNQSENYSSILALATGLNIAPNDGLPQKICWTCKEHVTISLNLRNKSQNSELQLLNSGYKRSKPENTIQNIPEDLDQAIDLDPSLDLEDLSTNCFNINGLKVEIELDRLTQDSNETNQNSSLLQDGGVSKQDGVVLKQDGVELKPNLKGLSVKEKRKIYMTLVEGDFSPTGPVKCKICMATVSKWTCFVNHAKKHLGFKFMCEFCGKSFISTNQLKRHCRSHHGLQREMQCPHCSYLALDKAQLQLHVRRIHTGARPFVCDVCSSAYFSRKCLLQHLESHNVQNTVQCDICPLLLKSRRHLAKHRYNAHGGKRKKARERAKENNQYNN